MLAAAVTEQPAVANALVAVNVGGSNVVTAAKAAGGEVTAAVAAKTGATNVPAAEQIAPPVAIAADAVCTPAANEAEPLIVAPPVVTPAVAVIVLVPLKTTHHPLRAVPLVAE